MEQCKYFKGDRPCKFYWVDRSWDCSICVHKETFSERILLIKLDALGDVLRSTALVEGLKSKFDPEITWLVNKEGKYFIENNPNVDRIMIYNEQNIRQLQCEEFDIVINLDKDAKATSICNLVHGFKFYGYRMGKEGAVEPFEGAEEHYNMCLDNWGAKLENTKSYQQMIFEMVDIPYSGEKSRLDLDTDAKAAFKKHLYWSSGLKKDDTIIVLNTGCGAAFPSKKWTIKGYIGLIEMLLQNENVVVILAGGKNEIDRNAAIKHAHLQVIDTTNKFSIEQFCYLIDLADVVVTGDTLALQVAVALKRPVVAMFGPGPWQETDIQVGKKLVKRELDCLQCHDQFPCPNDTACMRLITPKEVYQAIEEIS